MLVARASHAVIPVSGRSGTLSELALASQLGRPVVALRTSGGWAERLAGASLDGRRSDRILPADTPAHAVALAQSLLSRSASD